jgi:hypothetical protein
MTPVTNFSHEKNKTIQTVHGSEISFATTNFPILMHFHEILMQIFNSITYIPKQNLPHYPAFLFRKMRAQRDKKKHNHRSCQCGAKYDCGNSTVPPTGFCVDVIIICITCFREIMLRISSPRIITQAISNNMQTTISKQK